MLGQLSLSYNLETYVESLFPIPPTEATSIP